VPQVVVAEGGLPVEPDDFSIFGDGALAVVLFDQSDPQAVVGRDTLATFRRSCG
jgi:hypothetical protein